METPHWSQQQFIAYVLLYCARVDINNTRIERDYLKKRLDATIYTKAAAEIEKDVDIEALNKIQEYVDHHRLNKTQLSSLFLKIEDLFQTNDELDVMEIEVHNMLKKLLHP